MESEKIFMIQLNQTQIEKHGLAQYIHTYDIKYNLQSNTLRQPLKFENHEKTKWHETGMTCNVK